jgi:hypothetical protein
VPKHVEGTIKLTGVVLIDPTHVSVEKTQLIQASTISKKRKIENDNLRRHIYFYIEQGKEINKLIKKRLADENSTNSRSR